MNVIETRVVLQKKEKINGHAFLKFTTKKFRDCGMPGGTAMILADFAKECKEKKSRAFSSYRTKKDLNLPIDFWLGRTI
ncbi:hypothetical protein RhiirA5_440055 [Rhizophagus irregularis]|uniref:Uncharacterized protein n=1 Tax=Rhizophagus irregularis TaxID=588596 RepID=A0A2N0NH72_9GLOM|nr:hypothetical protein RhiirA5_440055 [Rhizophagus irregularis]